MDSMRVLPDLTQERLAAMAELARSISTVLPPETYRRLPTLAVHGDFHPGNLKFHRGRVIGLYDFDWANLDLRVYDLALALNYFCSIWDSGRREILDLGKLDLFLDAYQSESHKLQGLEKRTPGPLSLTELGLLPDLLLAGNLFILDWIISDYQEERISTSLYRRYLGHNLELTRWLVENKEYLRSFMSERFKPCP